MLSEELNLFDSELKFLFMDEKFDEMNEKLNKQRNETVKELTDHNWNIVKKYYEAENDNLLIQYFRFVAYTCFLVEYAYKRGLISNEAFQIMMSVYQDIYEMKKKNRLQSE